MRPETITQILRKHFFGVTDVSAIGSSIPGELLCVISVGRKHHLEAP